MLEVRFLGTGGSCAYLRRDRAHYGGNTPCVVVRAGEDTLVFDAGTGLCGLRPAQGERLSLFLSHTHMDHIDGLIFFPPLFEQGRRVDLYGGGGQHGGDFRDVLGAVVAPPLLPIRLDTLTADCRFHTLAPGASVRLSGGALVQTCALSHPGGALGYRVTYEGRSVCYCTDVELFHHQDDADLLALTRDAELLILDAFYDKGRAIPGWGHASWHEAAQWAKRANAQRLALFHHSFSCSDADITRFEAQAKDVFPNTVAAFDGMQVVL